MAKYKWEYLKTILKHKRYVMIECFKVGLYRQGLIHDLSKFSKAEFGPNAAYYNKEPANPKEKEKIEEEYNYSRLHHLQKNKHHLSHRVVLNNSKAEGLRIPTKYVLELCCDFIWAGKVYNKAKWDKKEPLEYRKNSIDKTYVHPDTQKEIEVLLWHYALFGTLK